MYVCLVLLQSEFIISRLKKSYVFLIQHIAAAVGSLQSVAVLLDYGADPNRKGIYSLRIPTSYNNFLPSGIFKSKNLNEFT